MNENRKQRSRRIKQMCIFAMFGVLMFISKMTMEFLPNFHLLGMFIVSLTVVYRTRALIPIYVYVMLDGLFHGFNLWWYPYLYVWTVLWGIVMLLPKTMPTRFAPIVYSITAAFHGIIFGSLYAPFQAAVYGFGFDKLLEWILLGISFDILHAIGNFIVGILIYPCIKLILKLEKLY